MKMKLANTSQQALEKKGANANSGIDKTGIGNLASMAVDVPMGNLN
ncbi:MAG: hypothetical protein IPJ06_07845 [Saprospiraceae bacterium]|nr:hypothetical protein [Saprospiraceae bacterium]